VKELKKNLEKRYSYETRYVNDFELLRKQIFDKTIIPHQVEIQPGPEQGNICWLKCPYCYGSSSTDTKERLSNERYLEIVQQIVDGGVRKVVFAGYATDPLNYTHIEDLLQIAIDGKLIFGFHTKAIRVSDRLISLITGSNIEPLSYFSVSVDAGSNSTYAKVHGMKNTNSKLYDKVILNLKKISRVREQSGGPLDISATYLLNRLNWNTEEVTKSILNLKESGVDLIRFSFPQLPRGYEMTEQDDNVPNLEEIQECMRRLSPIIDGLTSTQTQVLIIDMDQEYDQFRKIRTTPCFARYIYPSIGFDGYLAHCSESAAPHFRDIAIGNLNEIDFWDLFYSYDPDKLKLYYEDITKKMEQTGCKCDRKEHVVNQAIINSGVFDNYV